MIDKRIWRLLIVLAGFNLIASTTALGKNLITHTDVEEMEGPIITPSNKSIILDKGQNFTIYCKGKSELKFKQQEIPEEVIGPFYMEQRNVTSLDVDQDFEIALDLYYVDQFAVGFYACFDNTINDSAVLNNIVEEPINTAHVSYIYVYVNGSDSLFAPMREVVIARTGSKIVIECRPTTPDIKVKLTMDFAESEYEKYSPRIGFTIDSYRLSDDPIIVATCVFTRRDRLQQSIEAYVHQYMAALPPKPTITGGPEYFLNGETFSLNCTVVYQRNSAVMLSWIIPHTARNKVINETNEHDVTDGILYYNLTIVNATKEDNGTYVCLSKNGYKKEDRSSFTKIYLEKPFINMKKGNEKDYIEVKQKTTRLQIFINEHPPSQYSVYRNNKLISTNNSKFQLMKRLHELILTIRNLTVTDSANYTVNANNYYVSKNVTYDLRVKAAPIIDFGPESDKTYLENTNAILLCEAIGYPLPDILWIFSNDEEHVFKGYDEMKSIYKVVSTLEIPVHASGNITCKAENSENISYSTRRFLVYEMPDGFGIKNAHDTWFSQDQTVILKCLASKYYFKNVTWYREEEEEYGEFVEYSDNTFSHVAKLKIDEISLEDAGNYTCFGIRNDESEESETITITVTAKRSLAIKTPKIDKDEEVYPYQPINLTCQADAVPPPQIEWHKDRVPLVNSSNIEIITHYLNHTTVNSSIRIKQMKEENRGKYECIARSQNMVQSKFYNLVLKENSPYKLAYLSIIVIIFILVILVVYLAWKIRKEKQFRKELAAAGLLYFKEGHTRSLNPELGIDEQAELLPYDEKFEFPAEKLLLGKQLGAGAFGVVYKAEARGIINAEENTTVAVKMVKKTADNMYIKALASELKIMVHLGKHINIVNLLGACTKNVGKRELIVIVEYCQFGNIHNYMQKHREVFIDQLTDSKEKNLGKVNRGFSYSNGSNSDYFGSNHSQETDHTFLNTANTNRSGRKVSETGYVQPEWRSNYETDYSFDGRTPRPLCSRDLLAWAFQIARGMEYLASRKVLHGDLAARNVLLAEDNIVKICDFGLARSIYKNDEYQKKENSPLPVKWLAIECMTDRIFSTQSDVWSFGIVLWELFSLAKTPYPNISPPSLLQWLSEGHRLEKPPYADDRLYEVMLQCWEQKPTARPSFSQLQEKLGSFLEDNVRNHYVDLNSAYMDTNIKRDSEEDYLAMVCAPDYNNLVTPSPHHYVNDTKSFFPPTPTQLQHDDEGYLQMSPASKQNIFSPRAQNTKFDFDTRKMNPKVSEASSHGSELTPMLTLNNLPARSGSESDHEGNSSPYLNMCPRIEEESDEVFVMKQNNLKNVQNSAVTNPTYITFDVGLEKKPQDINNKYMNISTPNGLVK